MKKTAIWIAAAACLLLAACGKSETLPAPVSPDPYAGTEPAAETAEPAETAAPTDGVDVDLTALSSTMVYSEVYAMVYEPEEYLGKTVRMRGLFASAENEGQTYYACVIQDATACCAQGLEFEPENTEKLPEPGAEITVQGTFDWYREEAENGNFYLYLVLRDATIL